MTKSEEEMQAYLTEKWQDLHANRLEPISDREVAFEALSHPFGSLMLCSPALQNDYEVVLRAVTKNWINLRSMPTRFCNDAALVLIGIQQHPEAFWSASYDLKLNPVFVLQALHRNPAVFRFFTPAQQANRIIVKDAVNRWWCNLEYASQTLRNDPEIVLTAVRNQGRAIRYASSELRNNREFALSTVIDGGGWQALDELPVELKLDRDFNVSAMTRASPRVPKGLFPFNDERNEKRGWAASVLARLKKHETRAQRLWERVRILVFQRSVLFHWVEEVAKKKGKSEFENPDSLQQLEGKTTMSGCDAHRLKREFEEDFA